MIGTIKTVYLGCAEKVSAKGNKYRVVSFLDDGQPVMAMLANECKDALPKSLQEVELTLQVDLGRYQSVSVIGIGC